MRDNKNDHDNGIKLMEYYCDVDLREWQIIALSLLENQNDRGVLWFVDYLGGSGKTWFAKYLSAIHNAFYCTGGKASDIAHAFKLEQMVVFDFTRSNKEFVNYSVIESFKNGMFFSPKYNSITKKFAPCKVICFSNWDPDKNKLSMDRWCINYLFKNNDEWKLRADDGADLYQQLTVDGFLFHDDDELTPPPRPLLQRSNAMVISPTQSIEGDEKEDHQ